MQTPKQIIEEAERAAYYTNKTLIEVLVDMVHQEQRKNKKKFSDRSIGGLAKHIEVETAKLLEKVIPGESEAWFDSPACDEFNHNICEYVKEEI